MLQNMDEFDRDGRRLMEEFFKLFFNRNILILNCFGLIWNWFILLMIGFVNRVMLINQVVRINV